MRSFAFEDQYSAEVAIRDPLPLLELVYIEL